MTNRPSDNAAQILPRESLTPAQQDAMFQLLQEHFDGVTPDQFDHDLNEKNWVILIHRDTRLIGFSTLLAYESSFEGEAISVIYSGDTIVSSEGWGSTLLSKAWISAVNQLRSSYPRGKYYWLLLTSGFRTYRFLPVFWRTFFPRFDAPTPVNLKRLLDHLAEEHFGKQYDATSGIVRFTQPQRLQNKLAHIPPGRLADPHIAFFLSSNAGHGNGDELVCLTELHPENLTDAGRRMVGHMPS